jgi:hypothetical protein
MTDFSTIRVIPFYGKSKEYPMRTEKCFAKAGHYIFTDMLLAKVKYPKTNEDYGKD